MQASWWDHPRLGDSVGHRRSDGEIDQWLAWLAKLYEGFAGALGERLFVETPRLLQRIREWRHLTLIQGDAHVRNSFLPKDGTADTLRLFDWDGWRPAVGTKDLAYMIAMHWYPEMRQRTEKVLLDAFHEELLAGGVTGYDRHALQDD